MKIEDGDPVHETFRLWRGGTVGLNIATSERREFDGEKLDAEQFVDYVDPLLSELETIAIRLNLKELSASLSLCRNVARLSGGGD